MSKRRRKQQQAKTQESVQVCSQEVREIKKQPYLTIHESNTRSRVNPKNSMYSGIPTIKEIQKNYGHAVTNLEFLQGGKDIKLAMDNCLEEAGFYSLVEHAYKLGQPPQGAGFIGYTTLSALAQNGVIISCIKTVADDMLREWITLENKGESESHTEVSHKITLLEKGINDFTLRHIFLEAVTKTRYFGGGLIFIDTGVTDPETLKRPLDKSEKSAELRKGGLKGFTFIEPINVFPGQYDTVNPLSPQYFTPQSWWVNGKEVHASRFIKITTGDVPILLRPSYNFFGIPTAQILWDYVLHFQKDHIAVSRMLGKYSDTVFKMGGLRELLSATGGARQIDNRLSSMAYNRNNDSVTAIDMEHEDIVKVESNLSGLTDIVRQRLELICAINRTPAVKLLCISPSGFNATGESDITNYNDHIGTMQENILRTPLSQVIECLQLHLFGTVESDITFSFKKLNKDDEELHHRMKIEKTQIIDQLLANQSITVEGAIAMVEQEPHSYIDGFIDALKATKEHIDLLPDYNGEYQANEVGESLSNTPTIRF